MDILKLNHYIDMTKLYKISGYREKSILGNLKDFYFIKMGNRDIIEFIDIDNCSFLLDIELLEIVG